MTSNPPSGASINGSTLQLTLEESPGNPADPDPAAAHTYDYICWTEDGTPPSCNQDCPQSEAGSIDNVLQGEQHANGTTAQLTASGEGALSAANFPGGVTLFAVGCQSSTPAPAVVFGSSPVAAVVVTP